MTKEDLVTATLGWRWPVYSNVYRVQFTVSVYTGLAGSIFTALVWKHPTVAEGVAAADPSAGEHPMTGRCSH